MLVTTQDGNASRQLCTHAAVRCVSQNLNMLRVGRAIARWRNVVSVCADSRMGTEIRLLLGRYTIHGDRYTIHGFTASWLYMRLSADSGVTNIDSCCITCCSLLCN